MATTATERDVQTWVRDTYLPKSYKSKFTKKKLQLTPGGTFEFDAVSDDGSVVASVCTAGYRTTEDKPGEGKMHKVRSDAFFLLLVEAPKKLLVFTERDMHEAWQKEQISGRMPAETFRNYAHHTFRDFIQALGETAVR